jgi:cytoskeletal protein CcmA (bactofilin family)
MDTINQKIKISGKLKILGELDGEIKVILDF